MRLSPRILLIPVVAVLASLMPAASPALAQSPAGTVEHTVCDRQVCLTVSLLDSGVETSTEIYISAHAEYHGTSCGHFEATVTTANGVLHTASTCAVNPTWYSGIDVPARSGTVSVRFISDPPTVGEPLVRF